MRNNFQLCSDNFYRPKMAKIVFLLPFLLFAISCSTTKNVVEWNVEIKESNLPITDRCNPNQKLQAIKTPEKPIIIPANEDRDSLLRVYGLPCSINEEMPVYDIPLSRIKRITYLSDPLMPPQEIPFPELSILQGCCRNRTGLLFFDKFELRAAIGFRGTKDGVTYPPSVVPEKPKFISFGREGSYMTFGFEIAGLWNLSFIDKNHNFQAGITTGLWPVDGSFFVPVGLDLRYTFNQFPPKFSDRCNSWYLYGNIGIPLDFTTKAPYIGKSLDFQRYFLGAGIGYDWAWGCDKDFSIDLGYRGMNLPLPPFDCCPTIPDDSKNPFRHSNELLLRFCITY
ncbi:MAG: hypothetical protein NT007_16635 [Candidatus Kapabacteria bacterium]|nr:hypothetical protein [Candidatus Kapabacteria bacterium]